MIWEIPEIYEILELMKIGLCSFNISAAIFILLYFVITFVVGTVRETSEQISEKGVWVYNHVLILAKCSGIFTIFGMLLILLSVFMLISYPR
jgi:hypothetical protein